MHRHQPTALFALALAASSALAVAAAEPLFEGLGTHSRPITTNSPEAQRYFDQGLNFYFGFNHGAAIRSFQEAARLDPGCAMAHWGVALANGPHINIPMVPPPAAAMAWKELVLAQQNAGQASPVERALIAALAWRYADPQPADRGPLDRDYADAMREVWRDYPQDADVGTLFAEALMDLRPWDQWTPAGQERPGTAEVLATLNAVIALDVNHPFANHLYIHAVEASPLPARALAAADRLLNLQPGLAHNVHMASHIYIRIGRWDDAVDSNSRAIAAVRRYEEVSGPAQGPLLIYNAHNEHMLAYAGMMTGQSEMAISHIRTMATSFPEEFLKEYAPFVDAYVAMPYEVLLRFGRWDDVLAAPDHAAYLPFSRAMRHAARGIAFAAKGDVAAARTEQQAYLAAAALVPATETAGPVVAQTILAVVEPMVAGEILYRDGHVDEGLAKLREAVHAEDALHYIEPPAWFLPVRHSLGASLMRSHRFAEAEQVYRDDLARLPENGWSLFGLAESLRLQRKQTEAAAIDAQFRKVWAQADVQIHSSCFCQPGVELASVMP